MEKSFKFSIYDDILYILWKVIAFTFKKIPLLPIEPRVFYRERGRHIFRCFSIGSLIDITY